MSGSSREKNFVCFQCLNVTWCIKKTLMCFYNDYMQQSKSSLSLLFFKLKQQQINKLGKSMWFDVTVIDYHYTCYQIVCRGKNGNSVTFFLGGGHRSDFIELY